MKSRSLNLLHDFVAAVLNYLVVVSAWIGVNALAGVQNNIWMILLFLLIPVFFYFVRAKVLGFIPFTLLHIAVPVLGIMLLQREMTERVIVGIVLILLAVISYRISMKNEDGKNAEPVLNPLLAGIVMFLSIMAVSYSEAESASVIPKLALLFIVLYLPYEYFERLEWFDFINSKTIKNVPTDDVLKNGGTIVLGFAAFYGIIASVCLNEKLINRFSLFIRKTIRDFMAFITSRTGEVESEDIIGGSQVIGSENNLQGLMQDNYEPSKFALFFEKAAIYLMTAIIVAAVIFVIVTSIALLVRRFKNRKRGVKKIKTTEHYEEIRESVERKKKSAKSIYTEEDGPYAERIRKLYKKLVRRNSELSERPEKLTAREFAALFESDKAEKAARFVEIYEKARYSQNECTKSDYAEAKRFVSSVL